MKNMAISSGTPYRCIARENGGIWWTEKIVGSKHRGERNFVTEPTSIFNSILKTIKDHLKAQRRVANNTETKVRLDISGYASRKFGLSRLRSGNIDFARRSYYIKNLEFHRI